MSRNEAERKELLTIWWKAVDAVAATKPLVEKERDIRKQVIAEFFPKPKEGSNLSEIDNGWHLKLNYPMKREIDEALVQAVRDTLEAADHSGDKVIVMRPKLDLKEYRGMPKKATDIIDRCIIMKPGSASLELVPPKAVYPEDEIT